MLTNVVMSVRPGCQIRSLGSPEASETRVRLEISELGHQTRFSLTLIVSAICRSSSATISSMSLGTSPRMITRRVTGSMGSAPDTAEIASSIIRTHTTTRIFFIFFPPFLLRFMLIRRAHSY